MHFTLSLLEGFVLCFNLFFTEPSNLLLLLSTLLEKWQHWVPIDPTFLCIPSAGIQELL
jgi:hypothetical protein